MRPFIVSFLLILMPLTGFAEDAAIARLFAEQGIDGSMVIASLTNGQAFTHNDTRARQRFPTASTFKIFNTLIALEEHAISGPTEVLSWDGQVHDFPDWNHDQTLESAFKASCVWCYQELARRIGADNYRRYLQQAGYGEWHEPFETTTFWLDGSLTISAWEQVDFLRKIYRRTLGFRPEVYDTLQQIMLVEQTPRYTLRAKTGWATRSTPQTGWYVGYVETRDDVWFFALNMTLRDAKDLPLRQQLSRAALQNKGIMD